MVIKNLIKIMAVYFNVGTIWHYFLSLFIVYVYVIVKWNGLMELKMAIIFSLSELIILKLESYSAKLEM